MLIAVDGRFLQANAMADCRFFAQDVVLHLIEQCSEHQFILLTDTDKASFINLPENARLVTITPKPTNIVLYKWWYDVRLPLVLKKQKADIFVGTYGICSLMTAIPQLLIMQDLAVISNSSSYGSKFSFFHKKFTFQFLKKAAVIAVFSYCTKKEIIGKYALAEEKITVIGNAADSSFKHLHWEEREKVKEQYAQGCEYFLFTGGYIQQKKIINLLKAFSVFKKWQKTNMKLVIAGNIERNKDFSEKLNTYKYKNEVFFAENLSVEELSKVTAGAYAAILPFFDQGFAMAVLEAMQCEVPVITSADSSMAEIAGDAALYADPAKPEEIAEEMKRIFKDEQLRNKTAAAGRERAKQYNWDATIALTWQAVKQAVSG